MTDKFKFDFISRYEALGIPVPDVNTMCRGQCEGTGFVPIYKDEPNDKEGNWHDLWVEAEKKNPTGDGWHFVRCPACNGTGKALEEK